MNEKVLTEARASFHSFIEAFEKRDYAGMERFAQYCKDFAETSFRENTYSDTEYTDAILDIVCFVYDQMYWYEEKAEALKLLIDLPSLLPSHKRRALENLLAPTDIPLKDAKCYEVMLQTLLDKEATL